MIYGDHINKLLIQVIVFLSLWWMIALGSLGWVFLLKQKSYLSIVIPKFFSMILTQFDKKIKEFRFDNAQKLAFIDFFF